ncbi:MAG: type I glyceraldehyde-3-phosphate dehydrogenase [Deltaproteobacteria bacterium]|nr:type I glyceraldehyde-3-phosphate dehydrogenase [Deltaproteobacteria bacterium]MBW2306766.1 type I glyceraldehyde-3-phosphate dehydrogenase [Deltaproteobacteria bacterium]
MRIRVAINGFGRVGRSIVRAAKARPEMQMIDFVGINDLMEPKQLAMTLKYDSIRKIYPGKISIVGNYMIKGGDKIEIISERDPAKLPWKRLNVDVVVDCIGTFTTREQLVRHLDAGAKKVILGVPPEGELDATIVMGVNDMSLTGEETIVSSASCTTHCAAPVFKVLHQKFGVRWGFLTTVHAYTNDQNLLDYPHKDMRRARAAALSIIPTTTGAVKMVETVIPELKGRLQGMAYRVPVADGSVCDLMVELERETTLEEINQTMRRASVGSLRGILEYATEPLVSVDIVSNPYSSIFDAGLTQVINGNLAKVSAWYDNEWGFANRILELIQRIF